VESVLWPTLSALVWIVVGWLVCVRAVEGERRMAGVRHRRARTRLWWGIFGSLFGGLAVAALLYGGHALGFSERLSASAPFVPPSPSPTAFTFFGTLAVALFLFFLRLRWLRPSAVWTIAAALSAFNVLPSLLSTEGTEVLVLSALLYAEAGLLFVFPEGASRPYVFRNSRGGAVTAFVSEGVLALPLLLPTAWVSPSFPLGHFGEGTWFLWPALLPWALQVRSARGPLGAELRIRAGMSAVGALVSPLLVLFPAGETRATAMLVLVAVLLAAEEFRERAAARAMTSPWQEGEEATIVAVVEGSPAAELGIRPGMRLVSVNGTLVRDPQDAYVALQGRPAFVKLELKDLDGEILYRERGRYEGDPPLLGLVFAPRRFDLRRSAPPPEHGIALLRGYRPPLRAEVPGSEFVGASPSGTRTPAPLAIEGSPAEARPTSRFAEGGLSPEEDASSALQPPAQPDSGGIISEEWRG